MADKQTPFAPPASGSLWPYALGVFAPLAAVVAALFMVFALMDTQGRSQVVKLQEWRVLELIRQTVSDDLSGVYGDLRTLAEYYALRGPENASDAEGLARLADVLERFAEAKRLYDQVRFIRADGMERIRVNYTHRKATLVPPGALRNKKGRYYFAAAMRLRAGQVYVSRLDLNIEDGRVERPLRPTLRFATPVFDEEGQKVGVLVLNYSASFLLNNLERAAVSSRGEVMLLTPEGYWIHSPRKQEEWGFMIPERKGRTFASRFPEVWREIARSRGGQRTTDRGLFSFMRVSAADATNEPRGVVAEENWLVVSHIRRARWLRLTRPFRRVLLLAYAPISLLILGMAMRTSLARRRRQRAESALRRSEEIHRLVVSHTPRGAVFLFDRESACRLAEGAGLESMGLHRDDVIGRRLPQLFPEDTADVLRAHIDRALTGESDSFELALDGRFLMAYALPVRDETGAIIAGMLVTHDITERKEMEEKLRHSAIHDSLTEIFTRGHFIERLREAALYARRYETPLSFCICDIDRFKSVNDTYGHQAGDRVLHAFAEIIHATIRAPDFAGRYGGDELCFALPNASGEGGFITAERIRLALERRVFAAENGEEFHVMASFGVAEFQAEVMTEKELIEAADEALYQAKEAGRNQVRLLKR